MGATLVAQVLTHWTHLSDRAFRVLVRMAVTALDKPQNGQPAGIYRGGRDLLAMSLRSKKGSDRTRNRAVADAVAELTEAGAIHHLVTGWAGQKAVYRLTLERVPAIDDNQSPVASMGGPRDHPEGGVRDHPMDGPSGAEWVVSETTPRNQEEITKELAEEEWVGVSTTSHPPRAKADSPKTPKRCPDHHLRLQPRTDGLNPCPLCRAGAPPAPDELADVIPLNTRRPA